MTNRDEIWTRFSNIYWHDSKLIDVHVLQRTEKGTYDLQLDLDLIVSFSAGKVDRESEARFSGIAGSFRPTLIY